MNTRPANVRDQLTAGVIATEPQARNRLTSEARATVTTLEMEARRFERSDPDHARRLRWRADNLRAALEAMGR